MSENDMAPFFNWLDENGVNHDLVEINESSDIRGLISTRDLKAGEEVLVVPNKLFLFTADKSNAWCREHYPNLMDESIVDMARQLLHLASEFYSDDSFYAPYFSVLPKDFNGCPIFFTAEEKAELEGTCVLYLTDGTVQDVQNVYNELLAREPKIADYCSFEQYLFCFKQLTSRTFSVPESHRTLIPMLDMVNHSFSSNLDYGISDCKQYFRFVAKDDIKKGEELSIMYSVSNNTAFFVNYGFICEEYYYHDALVQGEVKGFGKVNLVVRLDSEKALLGVFSFLRQCVIKGKNAISEENDLQYDQSLADAIIDLGLEKEFLECFASMCESAFSSRPIMKDHEYEALLSELRKDRAKNYNKINITTCLQKETRTLLRVKLIVDFIIQLLNVPNEKALEILSGPERTPLEIMASYKRQLIEQLNKRAG